LIKLSIAGDAGYPSKTGNPSGEGRSNIPKVQPKDKATKK